LEDELVIPDSKFILEAQTLETTKIGSASLAMDLCVYLCSRPDKILGEEKRTNFSLGTGLNPLVYFKEANK
jgi:hypothetical protein